MGMIDRDMEHNKASETKLEAAEDREFWSNKLAALHIALRNGWEFSWPADPPAEWTIAALKEAAHYPARYIEIATKAEAAGSTDGFGQVVR